MPSPYSGLYPLISPGEKQRLYEIIERCGAMGLGYPMWFEDQYNGIIESMPPNVFMMFLDALVLEGKLFSEEGQKYLSGDLRWSEELKSKYPIADFGTVATSWEQFQDEAIVNLAETSKCYQDAAKIRRNVIPRYKRWYARDYGPHRPLESLNDPRYDHSARTL